MNKEETVKAFIQTALPDGDDIPAAKSEKSYSNRNGERVRNPLLVDLFFPLSPSESPDYQQNRGIPAFAYTITNDLYWYRNIQECLEIQSCLLSDSL